jgi:UDP-N-acetylmuramoyl-L-alanyl-D-glutamate--2,6-diaminopimelate ligase
VLNATDPRIRGLAQGIPVPAVTFGPGGDADAEDVELGANGISGTLRLGGERVRFETRLIGAPHLANLLAAATTCWRLGLSTEAIARGIAALRGVPGRLESIDRGQPFRVVVDYTTTGRVDARRDRGFTSGRLIAVFGCGGDRDRSKRPSWGLPVARRPGDRHLRQSEDRPTGIIEAIVPGVQTANCTSVAQEALAGGGAEFAVVLERRAAIKRDRRRSGDVVLIAGKDTRTTRSSGHEVAPRRPREAAPFRARVRRTHGENSDPLRTRTGGEQRAVLAPG